MTDMTEEQISRLGEQWSDIEKALALPDYGNKGYNIDPEGAKVLGRLFYDYMIATIYDNNWEGFASGDAQGIHALLHDMGLFALYTPETYRLDLQPKTKSQD